MRSRIAATAVIASGALLLAAPLAQAAPAKELTVDDNMAECPSAQFTSIEAAVLAAPPGAKIKVCPGTYAEKVTVDKPLYIQGQRRGQPDPAAPPDPTREAVVVNAGQDAFDVTADHVTIDGFRVQGAGISDATYPGAGIDLRAGADRRITDTVLTGNGIGVHINGAQQGLSIDHDVFYANTRGSNPSYIPTGAIFQDNGSVDNTQITQNQFVHNDQFDVNMGSGSNGGLSIDHNTSRDSDTFVVIGRARNASVDHNTGRNLSGNFVYEFGDNVNLAVGYNDGTGVSGISGTAILQPGALYGAAQPDVGTVISHNSMTVFFNGVRLANAASASVLDNDLSGNEANGIRLGGAAGAGVIGALIRGNAANNNAEAGIRADSNSAQNTIQNNRAEGNGTVDCRDDSNGPGTAGTANYWIQDFGNTQNRPGLCRPKGN